MTLLYSSGYLFNILNDWSFPMMMMITILNVPVAPAGACATSGGGGGKPWIHGFDNGQGIPDGANNINTYSPDRH